MVSLAILAAVAGGLSAVGATAAATGDASAAANVVRMAVAPGLKIALAHVPSLTHGHQVLTQHLSAYTQNGSTGQGGTAGIGTVVKNALAHGLGHAR
jgi:hypothetical protein